MAQLILLVVVAAWLAVLIPPMLRSRVENRPNSSVTDFRRQLTKLQNTSTPPRGAVRAMGRPLAQSPLARPAAGGRPGPSQLRSGLTRHATPSELVAQANTGFADIDDLTPRFRSHGDPSGGQRRPAQRHSRERDERPYRSDPTGGQHRPADHRERRDGYGDTRQRQRPNDVAAAQRSTSGRRTHRDSTGGQRRASHATGEIRTPAKQRRLNVMFVLVITTACTLFLAATTGSQVMFYAFALSFLSLFGYVWMLAQARQRAMTSSYDGWMDSY